MRERGKTADEMGRLAAGGGGGSSGGGSGGGTASTAPAANPYRPAPRRPALQLTLALRAASCTSWKGRAAAGAGLHACSSAAAV